ncbi:MAG: hypothetical protein IPN75_20020 [Dechloromonas sp.]|uniref:Uncharacterized protein n=1 Tax=Candidatus Dechloromonas phosphorivorans TaxID=2899244 RepID=A0A9D7LRI7_9RHOO|nr:hypothetical protein [Candidatus Dechloromonas phosphorivorans]
MAITINGRTDPRAAARLEGERLPSNSTTADWSPASSFFPAGTRGARVEAGGTHGGGLTAPMPGKVVALLTSSAQSGKRPRRY